MPERVCRSACTEIALALAGLIALAGGTLCDGGARASPIAECLAAIPGVAQHLEDAATDVTCDPQTGQCCRGWTSDILVGDRTVGALLEPSFERWQRARERSEKTRRDLCRRFGPSDVEDCEARYGPPRCDEAGGGARGGNIENADAAGRTLDDRARRAEDALARIGDGAGRMEALHAAMLGALGPTQTRPWPGVGTTINGQHEASEAAELRFLRAGVRLGPPSAWRGVDLALLAREQAELVAARQSFERRVERLFEGSDLVAEETLRRQFGVFVAPDHATRRTRLLAARDDLRAYLELAGHPPDRPLIDEAIVRLQALADAMRDVDAAGAAMAQLHAETYARAHHAQGRARRAWQAERSAAATGRAWGVGVGVGMLTGGACTAFAVADEVAGAAASCTTAFGATILGLIGVASNPTPDPPPGLEGPR